MISNNTYLSQEEYIEYYSELADNLMQKKLGKEYKRYVHYDVEGNSSYTEEGQDIFNDILDAVDIFLSDVGIYPESEEEKKNVRPI
tara:strand:+ start:222 stop:479 length:258 start_codon:yes stop_codon:yes gene_type:complete